MAEENQELEQEQQELQQEETEVQNETFTNEDQLAEIQAQKAELDKLKKEMFQKDVQFTLKEKGLGKFASIVKVENEEELKEVVGTLSQIVTDIKVSTGYVPTEHKKQNEYDAFASKGDTKGMIATKLSKLFR
ncbi:hypothetical protein [Bacillus norwichensis]|uniref:Scaffolding protein n=1 Tax=Bacillus norwichensis TaxID=2762217 RepID=A0ABR8VNX4_9BACI|nr:hypothetical protein [Bacillus norwichensis]MBD8006266.1 hypothetical protein [Bacillus norwichensis]